MMSKKRDISLGRALLSALLVVMLVLGGVPLHAEDAADDGVVLDEAMPESGNIEVDDEVAEEDSLEEISVENLSDNDVMSGEETVEDVVLDSTETETTVEDVMEVEAEPVETEAIEPVGEAEGDETAPATAKGLSAQAHNSRSTAKAIELGKTYAGKIEFSEDEDFYRVKLSKKTKVKVTATFNLTSGWANFYNSSGGLEWYRIVGTDEGRTLSTTVTLPKGTHYFTVEQRSASTGSYRFKLSATSAAKKASVAYRVHRQTYGWEDSWRKDGKVSGTTGQAKRLEGIRIKLASKPVSGGIRYRTHVQSYGWENWWTEDGGLSGTTGQGKRLEAIQIDLTGKMAERYDVWYRVHAQQFGWMGWAKNGYSAGTQGYGYRLEAIQVVLKAKGSKAPSTSYNGAKQRTSVSYTNSSDPMVFKGTRWRMDMPEYWRGQTRRVHLGVRGADRGVFPEGTASDFQVLDVYETTDAARVRYLKSMPSVGAVTLKSGQKVKVRSGDDGHVFFIAGLGGGRYLEVSTRHFKQVQDIMGSGGPTSSELTRLARLQSFGKLDYTDWWDYDVPLACLRAVAKRTAIG